MKKLVLSLLLVASICSAQSQLKAGLTSRTIDVFIQDSTSTTGAGLGGLVFNSAGLVCSYKLNRGARVAITLATQTVTGAWSSGGFVEIDATNMKGLYRLDLPDAAVASGSHATPYRPATALRASGHRPAPAACPHAAACCSGVCTAGACVGP